jgi:TolB-like protein/class 3 adenylate cyclase/Tfp pilus assembly protein PilF
MERRLAAVMIADVAGYGRLSRADEEGTRARFQADLHEVFEPQIAAHHGRLVKTMGDGLLVEFHSVVDAMRCAVDVQRAEAERNTGLIEERRLSFRIGINLGDVIVEGDDIHGDGVNFAERLQALAEPGGIVISGTAYDQVKIKLPVGFADLGTQRVKNVVEPVRAYRVLMDPAAAGKTIGEGKTADRSRRWTAAAATAAVVLAIVAGVAGWWRPWEQTIEPASVERMALPLPDKPSIAVLPFVNMSDDPKQEYFVDGMTDGLITELSQVSGLFVISRNSTFVYKGKTVPPKQVSEELGVRYVLEGSVQRAGDQLRINAQLIDALSGGHEWAGKFDGSLADVFALQDKVTHSVAEALAVKLTDAERLALDQQETTIPAAYDAFLAGWEHYRRTTPGDFAKAIPFFEEAIRLDPGYSRAYAALAMVYLLSHDRNWWSSLGISSSEAYDRAQRYWREAEKHPTSTSYQVAGNFWRARATALGAITEFKAAIALDPSDSWSYAYLAWAQVEVGQTAEAMNNIKTAIRLDPNYPSVFGHILGVVQLGLAQFEQAAESLERATKLNPEDDYSFLALAAAYGNLGRISDGKAAVARYNDIRVKRGGIPLTIAKAPSLTFGPYGPNVLLKKGLRQAGVPETLEGSEFAAQNRVAAGEVRALVFGRRLHGRTETGNEHAAAFTADGGATISGDWGELTDATVTFEGDEVCLTAASAARFCATILRNPGGTRATENEFIWLDRTGAYPFSQVE